MEQASIPVTIITGFLGAGKTTLINEILRDPAFSETVVLINEFGDVQVDHDLVADFSDELVMTTTGCLCCTASSDINQSLLDLSTKRANGVTGPFRRVIVETTGLMDPVPVIAALLASPSQDPAEENVRTPFVLTRVVTLFDIVNGSSTLDKHAEALKQVALSDVVLLTKTDLAKDPATRRDIEEDRQRVTALNPSAMVLDRQTDGAEIRELLLAEGAYDLRSKSEDAVSWLSIEKHQLSEVGNDLQGHTHRHGHGHSRDHDHTDRTRHGDDIRSHVITVDEPLSSVVFSFFLDAIKMIAGTDLLRLKGLVALSDDPDRPLVVHGVQHLLHPVDRLEKWPSDDRRTRIVVIGRDLKIDALRTILDPSVSV